MQISKRQFEATRLLTNPQVNSILYGGAIRGAKTIWGALTLYKLAMSFANSRWAMLRADRPKITTNLLPSVNEFYSQPSIWRNIKAHNRSELTYTFKNGSVIRMFPESFNQDKDLARFHGLEVNGFFFDELSEFQEKTWEKAFERAGAWMNAKPNKWGHYPRPLVLASCNPTKNWVKKLWYDPWVDGTLQTKKPNWRYVPAMITDNPFIKESYLISLKQNMSPMNYRRFVQGDWEYVESNGHEWLYQFDYSRHVKPVSYRPDLPTFLTYDFNVLPYQTLLCFQVEKVHDMWYIRFYDEYCLSHPLNNARDVTQAWMRDYGWDPLFGKPPVNYCGDAAGDNRIPGFGDQRAFNPVRQVLKAGGFLHNNSDRIFKKQFFNEFARTFLNDCLSGLNLNIVVEIDEDRCPNLIRDIQDTLENKDGGFTKEKGEDPKTGLTFEKNGHCVDAMKYGFLSVFSEVYLTQYHNKQY